jgi:hypothetical protein
MEESMEWMTLPELRNDLDRTRPAWEKLADLDDVVKDGHLPALSEDAAAIYWSGTSCCLDRAQADSDFTGTVLWPVTRPLIVRWSRTARSAARSRSRAEGAP